MEFNKPQSGDAFFLQSFTEDTVTVETPTEESEDVVDSILNKVVDTEEDTTEVETDINGSNSTDSTDSTDSTETDEDTFYEKAIKDLAKQDKIKELPEGVDSVTDVETFLKVLEHNKIIQSQEEIYNSVYDDLAKKLSPFTSQLVDFDLGSKDGGGDIVNFAKSILFTVDISDLDENNIEDQIEINKQYYLATGMKPEKVDKIIDSLKDNPEKLKAEAVENKPELLELKRKESLKQIEDQKAVQEEEDRLFNSFSTKLATQLQTLKIGSIDEGLEEFPITQKQAQYLYQAMTGAKYEVPIKGGKKVEMGRLEALAHFHSYSEKGNLNRLLAAMLMLEEPKVVFNHFMKAANSKVVVENKNQNNFSNNTGIVFNKKKPAEVNKKEEIRDKLFKQSL